MQKKYKTILLLFLLVLPCFVFSQNPELQVLSQNDINILNTKMQKSLKKCHCFSKKDSIKLFTFFTLFTTGSISKEEYADGSFLQKLTHQYHYYYSPYWYSKRDSLIVGTHIVYSKKKGLIATFSNRYARPRFLCNKNHFAIPYLEELMNYVWDKENLFIFQIREKMSSRYFFIVNNELEIFVFYDYRYDGNYNILPIKEFIDSNWERFYHANGVRPIGCAPCKKCRKH